MSANVRFDDVCADYRSLYHKFLLRLGIDQNQWLTFLDFTFCFWIFYCSPLLMVINMVAVMKWSHDWNRWICWEITRDISSAETKLFTLLGCLIRILKTAFFPFKTFPFPHWRFPKDAHPQRLKKLKSLYCV